MIQLHCKAILHLKLWHRSAPQNKLRKLKKSAKIGPYGLMIKAYSLLTCLGSCTTRHAQDLQACNTLQQWQHFCLRLQFVFEVLTTC